MLAHSVFAYLDDLTIVSKDPEAHLKTLKVVLLRFQEAFLKVKLSKFEFLKAQIKYLGYEGDGEGIHNLSDRIMTVKWFGKKS